MKTDEQIGAEVASLTEMKPRVRHYSAFSDDNHEAIEAQISVLRDRMSVDEIYDAFGDEDAGEFAQNVLDDALAAHNWMNYDHYSSPSEDWAPLTNSA